MLARLRTAAYCRKTAFTLFACSNDFYWNFLGGNRLSPTKKKQFKTFILQLIQRAHLTCNDSSDLPNVINCLVVYNIVLHSCYYSGCGKTGKQRAETTVVGFEYQITPQLLSKKKKVLLSTPVPRLYKEI